MNNNISNGGLVLEFNDQHIITDVGNYSGTYLVSDSVKHILDGDIAWFINRLDSIIYYSNQADNNYIFSYDFSDNCKQLIAKLPAYGLILYSKKLYYMDERDLFLYSLEIKNNKVVKVLNIKISCYTIFEHMIYYSTQEGIYSCGMNGEKPIKLFSTQTSIIVIHKNKIIFNDTLKELSLIIADLQTKEENVFSDISVQSINVHNDYAYLSNIKNDRTIYRIDLNTLTAIRICGDKTDKLHIIKDQIYYQNLKDDASWYNMSIDGGRATKVVL